MIASQAPPVYGGAGRQAMNLGIALSRLGWDCELLTQNQLRAPRTEVLDNVTIRRAPLEQFLAPFPQRWSEIARTLVFCSWLSWVLLFSRYDVLHLHGAFWFGVPAALITRVRRKPLILKTTRLGEDDAATVRSKRVAGLPMGRVYGIQFELAAMTIALSSELKSRHRTTYPKSPVLLLPNGVNVRALQEGLNDRAEVRLRLGISDRQFVVLFVGYLAPHKGVGMLLRAWSHLQLRRPGRLLLVGPSSGFYRELDTAISAAAESMKSVTMLEHVPFDEMAGIYAAADLFVLPTAAEGMPNSLLEALASGLPAVASEVPGVIEIAAKVPAISLIREVSADSIGDAIETAEKRTALTHRASLLPSELGIDHLASTYACLYERLMDGS